MKDNKKNRTMNILKQYEKNIENLENLKESVKNLLNALDNPMWKDFWNILNYFASGESQKQWSRVEPLAVLGEVYFIAAKIYNENQKVLKELKK